MRDTSRQFNILILYVTQSSRRISPNSLLVLHAYQRPGLWSIWLELLGEDSTGNTVHIYSASYYVAASV